ncbi:hypothetical protein JCM10207_001233 [Rhodosporidiobolus poonsookiae]
MSDSSDSESPKPAPPPFRAPTRPLAPELWLLVFQQKELKHSDYKRLERVCKDFKKLIESHSLDDRLFRSPPPAQPVKRGTKVVFHPALSIANLVCTSTKDAYVFINSPSEEDGYKEASILDYPCADEYATNPSSRKIKMHMGAGVKASNKEGVKVRDVIEAVAKMWSSHPPDYVREQVVEANWDWNPDAKVADVTWLDTLSDHRFWEGMQSARVTSEDEVLLEHHWFAQPDLAAFPLPLT